MKRRLPQDIALRSVRQGLDIATQEPEAGDIPIHGNEDPEVLRAIRHELVCIRNHAEAQVRRLDAAIEEADGVARTCPNKQENDDEE